MGFMEHPFLVAKAFANMGLISKELIIIKIFLMEWILFFTKFWEKATNKEDKLFINRLEDAAFIHGAMSGDGYKEEKLIPKDA